MAKVKNIAINIQIGTREYCFKNLILDVLLNNYAECLTYEKKYNTSIKKLSHCLISFGKFDNITPDVQLKNDIFDICILNTTLNTTALENKIINKYVCTTEDNYIYDYSKKTANNIKLNDYIGKKINFLGFSYGWVSSYPVLAILDVSNYDMYIQEGQEIRITRIDEISTDAIFTSLHESVKAPIHLYPNGVEGLLPAQILVSSDGIYSTTIYNKAYAKLTNFGLSNSPSKIETEYDIEGNYEVNSNVFSIKNIWSPKGLYLSRDLYPSDELYPDNIPYQYLILRFKLFQKVAEGTYENFEEVDTYTGAEYLQAIPLDKRGTVDFNIKYERG